MAAGSDDERPSDLLLKCLDSGRVDVLCSLLSQLKNKSDFHDQVDVLCCKEGTLLHRAVGLDSADFVSALLSNGANPCVQNEDGKTAYQMCKSDVVYSILVRLLKYLPCISYSDSVAYAVNFASARCENHKHVKSHQMLESIREQIKPFGNLTGREELGEATKLYFQ
ncbi:ankyrin repeat protein [Ancylostoma duodenale]|uniref:Ankyrin repeat protein n=1 Tax=Ancylostoma duodenale TaxID=51022 RepID=A0A0C2BYD7_9BILA|nr:ankyrin repeat protein [Ancylostoma duodenale]